MKQKSTTYTYGITIEKLVILKEILEPHGLTIANVINLLFDQLINNSAYIDNGAIVSDERREIEEKRSHLEKIEVDNIVNLACDRYPSSYKALKTKIKLPTKKEKRRRITNRRQKILDRANKILETLRLDQELELSKRYNHSQD